MNTSIFFSILGTGIYLTGFIPYIYHVFHGRVVPHPFSWTIWCIISAINTLALFQQNHLQYISLLTPMTRTIALGIGSCIGWIFIGKIKINQFDYLCLLLALLCLVITYTYGVSRAIIPTIFLDILVLFPTLKKIWNNPDSEDALTWVGVVLSQACILLSLGSYKLETTLFWGYVMMENALVALFIYRRKLTLHHWKYLFTKIPNFLALKKKLW